MKVVIICDVAVQYHHQYQHYNCLDQLDGYLIVSYVYKHFLTV